jgi:hypothetical protein
MAQEDDLFGFDVAPGERMVMYNTDMYCDCNICIVSCRINGGGKNLHCPIVLVIQ